MDNKINIEFQITIGSNRITTTMDEASELYLHLNQLFGNNNVFPEIPHSRQVQEPKSKVNRKKIDKTIREKSFTVEGSASAIDEPINSKAVDTDAEKDFKSLGNSLRERIDSRLNKNGATEVIDQVSTMNSRVEAARQRAAERTKNCGTKKSGGCGS